MKYLRFSLILLGSSLALPLFGAVIYTQGYGWERYRPPVGSGGGYWQDVDLNGDAVVDFYFRGDGREYRLIPFGENRVLSVKAVPPDGGRYTVALEFGQFGGQSPSVGGWYGKADEASQFDRGAMIFTITRSGDTIFVNSTIPANKTAYLGVEITVEGEQHYGWIALHSLIADTSASIDGWAYETEPGKGIYAGVVVPEPAAAMLIIGGLCFGFRRRKAVGATR